MSQQIEVYRVLNFHKLGSPAVAATITCVDAGIEADIGTSAVPLVLTEGTPIIDIYTTCASTSGSTSAQAMVFNTVMTGIAGVGGRALFSMDTNVALGGWSNALKALVTYGTAGRTTGLGSAFCAEIALSAGTSSGTYAPLESEIVLATGAVCGTSTSFLFMSANGAAVATWRTNGDLFYIQGMGTASSTANVFHTTGTVSATHGLRINIDGVDYDILLKASTYA